MTTITDKLSKPQIGLARLVQGLQFLVLIYSLFFILEFIILGAIRSVYPFELEWIEGAYVDQIRWVLDGNFPYVFPSLEFIPTSKTPLFFYLSAIIMKLIGVGFFAPRLLSILATLGCFTLLYLSVHQMTNQRTAGLIAAGIFAATYRFTGAWMDLAKTDSLFLFLTLAAFLVGARNKRPWGLVISGVLFVLAFFTKQLALPIILFTGIISLVTTFGRSWPQWLSMGVIGTAVFLGLESISSGWFSFYTIDTSLQHARVGDIWHFLKQLIASMWPALLITGLFCAQVVIDTKKDVRNWNPTTWQYIGFAAALIATSWGIHLKTWTYDNGYMPAALGLALLAGLGYGRVNQTSGLKLQITNPPRLVISLTLALLAVQYTLLLYNPLAQLPSKNNYNQANQFVEYVRNLRGEVWVFNHGFFNYLAGKNTYFHSSPFGDVAASAINKSDTDTVWRKEATLTVFRNALTEQFFDWVIIDKSDSYWLPYYLPVSDLSFEFYPLTGAQVRPTILLAPNPIIQRSILPLDDPIYNSIFVHGWGPPHQEGRWVLEKTASLQLALEQERDYLISIRLEPTCVQNQPVIQDMSLSWNQQSLTTAVVQSCSPFTLDFILPSMDSSETTSQLSFDFGEQINPSMLVDLDGIVRISSIRFIPQ